MKTQNNNFLTQLEKSENTDLIVEVKETNPVYSKTILTAADLWKIHSSVRPRQIRRFLI